jgi:methylmalonyl-CoA/ethylmalonyl-CoA epimerase
MIEKIDHIAIAVEDLQKGIFLYETLLGLKLLETEVVEDQGVHIAKLSAGNIVIELLSPLTPESPVAKFLQKRGPGIHHIALKTRELEQTLDELQKKGFVFTTDKPKAGADGSTVIFVHPKSTFNVLMELTTGPQHS